MIRVAHLSDLHVGLGPGTPHEDLVEAVLALDVDLVALTGDVTHRGRDDELAAFRRLYAPLLEAHRLLIVPGNHDRLGDDLELELMPGPRVQLDERAGFWAIRFNSTAPHNRRWLDGHGLLTPVDVDCIESALDRVPRGRPCALLLHHHLLPLPGDSLIESLATGLGWPHAAELPLGRELLERLRGRCDLVLHGHRHTPSAKALFADAGRPLQVLNGGSSAALRAFRVVEVRGAAVEMSWVDVREAMASPLPATG